MNVPPRPQGARRAVAGAGDRGPGRGGRVLRAQCLGQHGEGRHRVGLPVPVARLRHRGALQPHRLQAQRHHPGAAVDRHRQHAAGLRRRRRRGDGHRLHRRPAAAVAQLAAVDPGRRLCRVRPQHPAAVLRAVLVLRRARRPADAARRATISSALRSSTAAACRSRCPTTSRASGWPLLAIAGPDRRADRARPLGRSPPGADRPGLPDLAGGLRAVRRCCRSLAFVVAGAATSWDVPTLRGFNYRGGFVLVPEFVALFVALSTYTAGFIAEVVRGGILSVRQGQIDAARALGLTPGRVVRLVVIPQAMPVIIPPITSQYLNLIKNSSFGAAIAYPEIVGGVHGLGAGRHRPGDRDHRHHARHLSHHRARRVGVHELVQRPPSPGDAMTRRVRRCPAGWRRCASACSRRRSIIAVSLLCLYVVWRISCRWSTGCWSTPPGAAPRATTAPAPAPAGCSCARASASSCTASIPLPERWRVDLVGALAVVAARGAVVARACRVAARRRSRPLVVLPPLGIWLLYGGGFGLQHRRDARMGRADADALPRDLCRPDRHPARHPAGARPPLAPADDPLRLGRVHRVLARRADHHRDLPRLAAAAADHADRLRRRPPGARRDRPRLRDRRLHGRGRARRPAGAARRPARGRDQALGLGYWRITG